ncbi:MAG: DUF58 domain-containing protein [Planctomycetota bacterium]
MLNEELMQQVRRLELATKRRVSEVFSGEFASAFRGRGMEFDEVRLYQPGDDVRSIDWNVTARTGEPHIKRFVEERELTVMLAVDLSASGTFGTIDRSKNRKAAELCAVLAFVAATNNDKVGLTIFTDRVELFVPPRKGRRHVLRLIRELLEFEPEHRATKLESAIDHLTTVLRRRSVVFFVSDFLVDNESYHRPLAVMSSKHDVVALEMSDPAEHSLPALGLVDLVDAETGKRRVIDTGGFFVRRRHRRAAEQRTANLANNLRKLGVDHTTIRTNDDAVHQLQLLFRKREQRR